MGYLSVRVFLFGRSVVMLNVMFGVSAKIVPVRSPDVTSAFNDIDANYFNVMFLFLPVDQDTPAINSLSKLVEVELISNKLRNLFRFQFLSYELYD